MGSHRFKPQQPMDPKTQPTPTRHRTKRPTEYPKGARDHVTNGHETCTYCGIPVYFEVAELAPGQWWAYPLRGPSNGGFRLPGPPGANWDLATIDHVIPLSRGGTHTLDNFTLACHTCNSTKGARLNHEWQHALERIITRRQQHQTGR